MTDEIDRQYHEVANIFPLMQGAEFDELCADIKANGLHEAIWLHPDDGTIIDGRNRHRACLETGAEMKFRTWDGQGSLVSFVISMNMKRRHLNSSQRAAVAYNILPFLEAEAKERMKWTPTNTSVEIIPHSEGKARDQAAKIAGTNGRYVSDMKKVHEKRPEMVAGIIAGDVKLPQIMRQIRREEKLEEISQNNVALEAVDGKRYSVIYADPPWEYDFSFSDSRSVENHYPTMNLDDILNMPVGEILSDNAILFLWCPPAFLKKGLLVLETWGFEYRTSMVWDKGSIGAGQWVRQQHEIILIGRRGDFPTPEASNRPSSVICAPREEHSKKPEVMYEIIEKMYPQLERIELFARENRQGWDAWGNQV